MSAVSIGSISLGENFEPQVIAEIGSNHNGSIEKALELIEALATTSVKLVKFQFYSVDELVSDPDRVISWGKQSYQTTERVGEMFRRLSISSKDLELLFKKCKSLDLTPLATPFSTNGLNQILQAGTAAIKIASSDTSHIPLLKAAGKSGLPVIVSVGKTTLAEMDIAINCLMESGCDQLIILQCTASYPAPDIELNLNFIPTIAQLFPESVVGFSDHSIGGTAAIVAVAKGASVVEKHVTLDKNLSGPDHWFSSDVSEIQQISSNIKSAKKTLGLSYKKITPSEIEGRRLATRSLVALDDMKAGEILTEANTGILRPGGGISPHLHHQILGMKIKRAKNKWEQFEWNDFKE